MPKLREPDPLNDHAQGIAECLRLREHDWGDAGCALIPFAICLRCGKIARYIKGDPSAIESEIT